MITQSSSRQLHGLAADAREAEQFVESLTLSDQTLFAYDADGDTLGFAEGVACRSITLRVYANLHKSRKLLTLAKFEMMGAVQIARESGDLQALALPLYNLAQLQEDLGEFSEAVVTYKEAVRNMKENPPETHNRPSVLANMKIHMATCEYKAGDKSALGRAFQALKELEVSDEPNQFNKDVWLSGAYMRLAEILKDDDAPKAKEYLQKAKEIIDGNPKLTLRKKQFDELVLEMKITV